MIALLWAKLGKWVAAAAALAATLAGLFLLGHHRGAAAQAQTDAAKHAAAATQAAQTAQATIADATAAANAVAATAHTQPPPDTVKRDDFNNTF